MNSLRAGRHRRGVSAAALALAALAASPALSDAYYIGGGGEADYDGGSDTIYRFGVGLGLTDLVNLEIKYSDYGNVDGQGDDGIVYSAVTEWAFSGSEEASLVVEIGADSGSDLFLGAGVMFKVSSSISVLAQYEIHEIDDYEFSAIVISARLFSF